LATKKAKNKKRLVLHNYDFYQDSYEKPRLVPVHTIKPHNFRLNNITPKTENQKLAFAAFNQGNHLMLHGMAGTGKTFLSLYLSLNELLNNKNGRGKIYIVRSIVPTRDIGFLPGDQNEKTRVYEAPYQAICNELFGRGDAYQILKQKNIIEFVSTSFIRGITLNNCFVLVDEFSNCNFHELDSVITRTGENCRLIFCGDFRQSDLTREQERNGIRKFMQIIQNINGIVYVEFRKEDIVRSKLVSDYIIEREKFEACAS
jgi:phosphate starvation-inducible protein PhoH